MNQSYQSYWVVPACDWLNSAKNISQKILVTITTFHRKKTHKTLTKLLSNSIWIMITEHSEAVDSNNMQKDKDM